MSVSNRFRKSDPAQPAVSSLAARVAVGVALALGLASLWQVTEQDIFWQIRAGDELWHGQGFPEIDSWSFTAAGKPWWNVQWLSTLLFSAVYRLGGAAGLVLARAALVALLFHRAGLLALASLPARARPYAHWILASLLPLTWTAMAFRLELRSDTLVFVVFVELLLRRARGVLRPWQLPASVALAANLHVGTAPFVALLAIYCALLRPRTLAMIAPSALALFATPYHLRVVSFWWRHFFYASHTVMQNPDHQPLRPAHHFAIGSFGLYGVVWLALTVLAVLGFWLCWTNLAGKRAARGELLLTALGFLALTALCTNRIRTFPYQLFFILPHLARSLHLALQLVGERRAASAASIVAAFAFFVGIRQITHSRMKYGLGLSRAMYPIGSAAFIQREQLSPNLFHTFAYGAYTVHALRDYKDFVDTRETMFDHLQVSILDAYASPSLTQQTMERFGIHTTLVPIPKTEPVGNLGYRNAITEYLPKEHWALVYFDDISVVVIRRTPEHAAVIERHEYQLLYPNLPPGNFLRMQPTGERLARYQREIATCLQDEPDNAFCLRTKQMADAYVAAGAGAGATER